jgi:hypothetical protein
LNRAWYLNMLNKLYILFNIDYIKDEGKIGR